MKANSLVRPLITLVIAVFLTACGGGTDTIREVIIKDNQTDTAVSDTTVTDDSVADTSEAKHFEKMAVVTGTIEIPVDVDAGERDSAKVYVIGQEEYATTTDADGNFTLR